MTRKFAVAAALLSSTALAQGSGEGITLPLAMFSCVQDGKLYYLKLQHDESTRRAYLSREYAPSPAALFGGSEANNIKRVALDKSSEPNIISVSAREGLAGEAKALELTLDGAAGFRRGHVKMVSGKKVAFEGDCMMAPAPTTGYSWK